MRHKGNISTVFLSFSPPSAARVSRFPAHLHLHHLGSPSDREVWNESGLMDYARLDASSEELKPFQMKSISTVLFSLVSVRAPICGVESIQEGRPRQRI